MVIILFTYIVAIPGFRQRNVSWSTIFLYIFDYWNVLIVLKWWQFCFNVSKCRSSSQVRQFGHSSSCVLFIHTTGATSATVTLQEHMSSPPPFSGVRVTRYYKLFTFLSVDMEILTSWSRNTSWGAAEVCTGYGRVLKSPYIRIGT